MQIYIYIYLYICIGLKNKWGHVFSVKLLWLVSYNPTQCKIHIYMSSFYFHLKTLNNCCSVSYYSLFNNQQTLLKSFDNILLSKMKKKKILNKKKKILLNTKNANKQWRTKEFKRKKKINLKKNTKNYR